MALGKSRQVPNADIRPLWAPGKTCGGEPPASTRRLSPVEWRKRPDHLVSY